MKSIHALHTRSGERGIALLFVILLTSVLLLVALGITNISYRETTFSTEAQDSDRAFFAADTGIECALYLDNHGVFSGAGIGSFTCSGIAPYIVDTSPTFQAVLPLGAKACALINVNKAFDPTGAGTYDHTYIQSVGYNMPANTIDPTVCVTGSPSLRTVTRALGLEYPNSGAATTGTTGTTGTGGTGGGGGSGGGGSDGTGGSGGGGTPTEPPTGPATEPPSVTTLTPTSVTVTTALFHGDVTATGGGPVTVRGFDYVTASTFPSGASGPAGSYGTGTYVLSVGGLSCGTTYTVTARAQNSVGLATGLPVPFTTLPCP